MAFQSFQFSPVSSVEMSQFPTNNTDLAQDAPKGRKGVVPRLKPKPKCPQTASGTSGATGTAGDGGPSPPGTTSFDGEADIRHCPGWIML